MVDTFRGQLRVRAWPRKRGPAKHPHTRWMNHIFKINMRNLKLVDGLSTGWAYAAAKGTGLYPRDILYASATSGLFDIELPDGRTLTHRAQGIYPVSFQGIRVQLDANKSVAAGAGTTVDWPVPVINTAGMFDPGQPTRLIIPKGVNIVNVVTDWMATTDSSSRKISQINLNGSSIVAYTDINNCQWAPGPAIAAALPVQEGDYLEGVWSSFNPRTARPGAMSYMSVEIIDADTPVP